MSIWTPEEKSLLQALRPTMTTSEIQTAFHILGYSRSAEAIQKQSRKLGVAFRDMGEPATKGLNEETCRAIQEVLSERDNYLPTPTPARPVTASEKAKKTTLERITTTEMLDALDEIRDFTPRYGSASMYRPLKTGKESLVLFMSDWHYGHVTRNEDSGTEVFNEAIAVNRILETADLALAHFTPKEIERRFDECVILFGGDMITGEGIFPGQEMMTREHAAEQVKLCTKAAWGLVQQLRGFFPLVRIVTTRGNHGRTAGSPEANWDTIIYQQLELLVDMSADSGLLIKNKYGAFNTFEVKGWRGMLRHAAPVQADTAAGIAKFAGWHMIHDWDFCCYGHFHHWGIFTVGGKPIFRNGSLVSGDDYGERLAKEDQPAQLSWTIHEDNICTGIYPLLYKD